MNSEKKKTVTELRKEWKYKEVDYHNPERNEIEKVIFLTGYKGSETSVDVPSLIGKKVVKAIVYPGFSDNRKLVSVQIPDSIEIIGEEVFAGCKSLQKVEVLGKNVVMGDFCFNNCVELSDLKIDVSTTVFGKHMFQGCKNLCDERGFVIIGEETNRSLVDVQLPYSFCIVKIPDGVVRLLGEALSENNNPYINVKNVNMIRKVHLPDTIKEIGDNFFSGCSSLQQINIPHGVQKIGSNAFTGCESLREIHIPDTVIEIGEDLFDRCNFLEVYGKPGSSIESYVQKYWNLSFLSEVEEFSFLDDPLLQDFDIRNGSLVRYFGFEQELVIPSSVKRIESNVLLHIDHKFDLLEISGNTSEIGDFAFTHLKAKKLVLNDGVERIGRCAFMGSTIEELEIPDSVKFIESNAFFNCNNLKRVVVGHGAEAIACEALSYCSNIEYV